MFHYIIRRLLSGLFTLLLITLVIYALIRNMPGDPVVLQILGNMEKADIKADQTARKYMEMRKQYGLDKPIIVGYYDWLSRAIYLDFGESIIDKRKVAVRIQERLGPTLLLSITSLLLIYILSIPIGIYATAANRKLSERLLSTVLYVLYSIPNFVMALLIMAYVIIPFFGQNFPITGMHSDNYLTLSPWEQTWDLFKHMLLPVFCYTYGGLAYYSRFIRSNMMEVIRQDYIRTARAKGLTEPVVLIRHAFRNTLIPLVTLLGLSLPFLVSGSIILEQVFSWPGMGREYLTSITMRDYPMIMGITFMFSTLILIGNLLADVLYAFVDPRVTYS